MYFTIQGSFRCGTRHVNPTSDDMKPHIIIIFRCGIQPKWWTTGLIPWHASSQPIYPSHRTTFPLGAASINVCFVYTVLFGSCCARADFDREASYSDSTVKLPSAGPHFAAAVSVLSTRGNAEQKSGDRDQQLCKMSHSSASKINKLWRLHGFPPH